MVARIPRTINIHRIQPTCDLLTTSSSLMILCYSSFQIPTYRIIQQNGADLGCSVESIGRPFTLQQAHARTVPATQNSNDNDRMWQKTTKKVFWVQERRMPQDESERIRTGRNGGFSHLRAILFFFFFYKIDPPHGLKH